MDLKKVLFIGGNPNRLASVKIRCVDIARRLGCDYLLKTKFADAIPEGYLVFVCVKPELCCVEVERLAQRGIVIWDIIDNMPPEQNVSLYLASNSFAKNMFADYGRVELLPHYHCNFDGAPNPPEFRRPGWIGSPHWQPKMQGFAYDRYFVKGMTAGDVARVHRKIGIGLNLRVSRQLYRMPRDMQALLLPCYQTPRNLARITKNVFDLHVAINSGVKLINCIGFGIPSLSSDEPAYHEFGEGCTIFTDLKKCEKWVRALQSDDDFYHELRKRCIHLAPQFHINAIAGKYRVLLESL